MIHYFYNNTALDEIFIRQFGLSIKSEDAIGQFGTGLKYAIATILRGDGAVTLRTNGRTYEFGYRIHLVRDQEVKIVTCSINGADPVDLPFNITLGKNWKPWMAFRELLSNAWDEDGDYAINEPPNEHETVFEVMWGKFDEIDFHDYFRPQMPTSVPLATINKIILHEGEGRMFYKGVFVGQVTASVDLYLQSECWKNMLTEDRTIPDSRPLVHIGLDIQKSPDPIDHLKLLEERLPVALLYVSAYAIPDGPAKLVSEAVKTGRLSSQKSIDIALNYVRRQPLEPIDPTPYEQAIINRAISTLEEMIGGKLHYEVLLIDVPSSFIMGLTNRHAIYILRDTLRKSLRDVVETLIEEYVHIVSGASDETRSMQDALIKFGLESWLLTKGKVL